MGRLGIHGMICDDGAIGSVRGVRLPNVSVVTLDYLIEIGQGSLGSFVLGSAFSAQLRVAVLRISGAACCVVSSSAWTSLSLTGRLGETPDGPSPMSTRIISLATGFEPVLSEGSLV